MNGKFSVFHNCRNFFLLESGTRTFFYGYINYVVTHAQPFFSDKDKDLPFPRSFKRKPLISTICAKDKRFYFWMSLFFFFMFFVPRY